MNEVTGSGRSLTIGLIASVVLHAGGVVGLARLGMGTGAGSRPAFRDVLLTLPPEPPKEQVRPGIADSERETKTWLGFKDPTEHATPEASVEQAALAVNAGPPNPEVTESAAGAPGKMAVEPEQESAASERPSAALEVRPPVASEPTPSESPREELSAKAPEPGAFVGPPHPPVEEHPEQNPKPDTRAATSARPAQGGPNHSSGAGNGAVRVSKGGESGMQSDRESAAAAIKNAIEVKPGKPAAGKGVEITTVRPRWSYATQLTASPRNPVVQIEFGRTGKVVKAEFVGGQGTGSRDVDDPLMSALYRWTAKGEAIDRLASGPPDAVLTLTFRVMLR